MNGFPKSGTKVDVTDDNGITTTNAGAGVEPWTPRSWHIVAKEDDAGAMIEYNGQSTFELLTGGKGNSRRQNIFKIMGGAMQYSNLMDVGTTTPGPNIKIMGKPLGSDGNLWVMLPDNDTRDVTPFVKGVDHYVFSVDKQKYTPVVTANSVPLDPDMVVDGAKFCVGQLVTFGVSGLPDYVDSVQHWTLPGNYVNESYAYSPVCTSYRKNTDLLTNLTTPCWYVDKVDAGTASIGMNLHFSNGQYVSVAAQGKFDILKPKVGWTGKQPGTIAVDNIYEYSGIHLHFGYWLPDNPPESQDPGMKFTKTIPPGDSRGYFPIQLISRSLEACGKNGIVGHYSANGLDGGVNALRWLDGVGYYIDDPGVDCNVTDNHEWISDSFQTTLMFDPETGSSIAVPLKLITWHWSGTADNLSMGWQLTSSPDAHAVDSSDQDTTAFPVWTNIVNFPSGFTYTTNSTCQ
jgi:hypothetical protein